jgi:hypothetical protein
LEKARRKDKGSAGTGGGGVVGWVKRRTAILEFVVVVIPVFVFLLQGKALASAMCALPGQSGGIGRLDR